jgi:hypothetical protein
MRKNVNSNNEIFSWKRLKQVISLLMEQAILGDGN